MVENIDEKDSGIKRILPLIIFVLLVVAGFWFCGKPAAPPEIKTNTVNANNNVNANK